MNKILKKLLVIGGTILITFAATKGFYYNMSKGEEIVNSTLRTDIKVMLYTQDGCVYCQRSEDFLNSKMIPYEVVKLIGNKDVAIKLASQTGQNSVPYAFVNDAFIGGYQDLLKLNEAGKL